MNECDELLEDSDSSDEDYIPEQKLSEEESDGGPEFNDLSDDVSDDEGRVRKSNKRFKNTGHSKRNKKIKLGQNQSDEESGNSITQAQDAKKQQSADDVWADFMKDTGFQSRKCLSQPQQGKSCEEITNKTKVDEKIMAGSNALQSDKVKITQMFEFAGEEVKVEREVSRDSAEARLLCKPGSVSQIDKRCGGLSGISSVLSQLGKKPKISTLEKSKLDWDKFKKDENIEEELLNHNKGKDGYLERQDFLERTDLRRFEIEKDLRTVERNKRFTS